MSARTEAMMVNTPIKAQQIALKEMTDEMRATRAGFEWKLDLERGRLITESYQHINKSWKRSQIFVSGFQKTQRVPFMRPCKATGSFI